MIEASGRTVICSVAFLDIVDYSSTPVARQMAMKQRVMALLQKALHGIAESERIVLDTGDGAAVCFFGDPEDALFTATSVREEANSEADGETGFALRVGLNLGPVKVITDLSGRLNVVGDGINVAQRVMSFAAEGEILSSRSYYEVVSRLREGNERLFRYLGARKDKHVREHQLYAFGPQGDRPAERPAEEAAPAAPLSPKLVAAAESRLNALIGPLASVIVRRAAGRAESDSAFCGIVAAAIPDEADRATFLSGLAPEGPPAPSYRPAGEAAGEPAAFREADLARAERALAEFIGPLARVLTRKAARESRDLEDLHRRLAGDIADEKSRRAFLAAVLRQS